MSIIGTLRYTSNVGNPHGLTVNPLILAVRYIIAVANVIRFFLLGWEISRSIGVSNSQVTVGSIKCPGNFTSLDTPLLSNHWCSIKLIVFNTHLEKALAILLASTSAMMKGKASVDCPSRLPYFCSLYKYHQE